MRGAARKVGRRFRADLAHRGDLPQARGRSRGTWRPRGSWGADDESFAAEVPGLEASVDELSTQLADLLAPRDPHDADDVVLEVKSGEGGEESALFAADLARMYIRYAERHGWTVTVLDETISDLGGYKDATLSIRSKGDSTDGVWVAAGSSRAACTACKGFRSPSRRAAVHTSAAGVLAYPEPEEVEEVQIDESGPSHRRLPVVGQGWPGASNTTPNTPRCASPTCPPASWSPARNERSQLQNKGGAPCRCWPARLQGNWLRSTRRPDGVGRPGQPDPHCRPQRSASARTTSLRTGSPITGSTSRRTTSTRCSTATSTRSLRRNWPRPTNRQGCN